MDLESKIVEHSDAAIQRHDACLRVLGPMLDTADSHLDVSIHEGTALKWLIIESLCLMVGKRSGLPDRAIAEQVERLADSIANGG